MAMGLMQGLTINNNESSDDRLIYPTVAAFLSTGGEVNGVSKPKVGKTRRYPFMQVVITSEKKVYWFDGGVEDADFKPMPGGDISASDIEDIVKDYLESSEGTALIEGVVEEKMDNALTWTVHA